MSTAAHLMLVYSPSAQNISARLCLLEVNINLTVALSLEQYHVVDCYILRQNQGSYAMLTVSALVCVPVYRCIFGCVNKITQKVVDVF